MQSRDSSTNRPRNALNDWAIRRLCIVAIALLALALIASPAYANIPHYNQRTEAQRTGATGEEVELWRYTASNQIARHSDAEGAISQFAYDLRDRVSEETNPASETRHYAYDGNGNRTQITLPNGQHWTQAFDAANRLTTVTSPEGKVTVFGYHPDDQLASIRDGNGHEVTLTSDALARIKARVYPDGASFSTSYDGEGNASSDSRPDSQVQRQFDALNRARAVSYSAASGLAASITTQFDPNSNPREVSLSEANRSLHIERSFDDQNRLQAETSHADAAGPIAAYRHQQRYGLDGNSLPRTRSGGNRITVTDASNISINQSFDAQNRLLSSTSPEGSTQNHWNKDGTLAGIDHGNGTVTSYQYDRAKRITQISHSQNGAVTLAFDYQYDANGNRTNEIRTESAINGQAGSVTTTEYGYDNDDRLIQSTVHHQPEDASRPDQRSDWTLDAVGNRLTETVTRLSDNTETANKQYSYNNRDQLTLMQDSVNQLTVSYAYDGNGNRVSRTVTRQGQPADQITYTFDARDRLIKAEPNAPNPTNTPTVEYVYDAEGRRIERIESPASGSPVRATLYLYDGATLAHEAAPDAAANTPNRTGLRLTDSYRHSAKLAYHLEIDAAGNPTITFYQLDALDIPVRRSG